MPNVTAIYSRGAERSRAVTPEVFVFPGGEVQVSIDLASDDLQRVVVSTDIRCSDDVMALLMLTDAIRRQVPAAPIDLNLPYVPYARQDRVCNPGEALAAKVFCSLINAQNYATVTILDPHSDVVPALLDRVRVVDASAPLRSVVNRAEFAAGITLLAPDAGARKRVLGLANKFGIESVAFAEKVRCTKTGAITGVSVPNSLPDRPVLVVDDICDGGRTFVELAAALRKVTAQPLYLYVTHGIFSKGVEVLLKNYERLYTTNDWTRSSNPAVTVIPIGE